MAIGKVVRDYYAPQGAVSAVHQYALVADRYVRKYDVPPEAMGGRWQSRFVLTRSSTRMR